MSECTRCGGSGVEPDHRALGAAQRQLRTDAGISLRAMAVALGFSPSYISDLELGRRMWSAGLIKRYKEAVIDHLSSGGKR